MREFQFAPRPTVKICGMEFDLDITDVGMISAVIDSFSSLMERYQELKKAQEQLMQQSEDDFPSRLQAVEEANRSLYETAKGFITRVLGIEDYDTAAEQREYGKIYALGVLDYLGIAVKPQADTPPESNPDKPKDTPYTVQVGAFSAAESAAELYSKLSKMGYFTFLRNETLVKVCVGKFPTQQDAQKTADDLKKKGFGGFVTIL